jgi:hypothetical protein
VGERFFFNFFWFFGFFDFFSSLSNSWSRRNSTHHQQQRRDSIVRVVGVSKVRYVFTASSADLWIKSWLATTLCSFAQIPSDIDDDQTYNFKGFYKSVWYVITEFIGHWFNSFTNNFQAIKMCIFWQIQHGDCSEWQEVIFLTRENYGIHYTYSKM